MTRRAGIGRPVVERSVPGWSVVGRSVVGWARRTITGRTPWAAPAGISPPTDMPQRHKYASVAWSSIGMCLLGRPHPVTVHLPSAHLLLARPVTVHLPPARPAAAHMPTPLPPPTRTALPGGDHR
ncbi:hypothetical protein Pen02_49960 [Plantactinospora endophytica]|uniref:Uncharacterized protein n=1 Tax=Plantactinospora endophytica TaxID=673535 RepID=A0ABQ4E5R6_9ACTN|nr:hypothetical protein Pen02_49960 [Plantactinospora endophytica]